jgi:hypothetical protein
MGNPADDMQLVEDCENRESKLSEWERDFIDSLKRQLEAGRSLTVKQDELLNVIWDRVT